MNGRWSSLLAPIYTTIASFYLDNVIVVISSARRDNLSSFKLMLSCCKFINFGAGHDVFCACALPRSTSTGVAACKDHLFLWISPWCWRKLVVKLVTRWSVVVLVHERVWSCRSAHSKRLFSCKALRSSFVYLAALWTLNITRRIHFHVDPGKFGPFFLKTYIFSMVQVLLQVVRVVFHHVLLFLAHRDDSGASCGWRRMLWDNSANNLILTLFAPDWPNDKVIALDFDLRVELWLVHMSWTEQIARFCESLLACEADSFTFARDANICWATDWILPFKVILLIKVVRILWRNTVLSYPDIRLLRQINLQSLHVCRLQQWGCSRRSILAYCGHQTFHLPFASND